MSGVNLIWLFVGLLAVGAWLTWGGSRKQGTSITESNPEMETSDMDAMRSGFCENALWRMDKPLLPFR